METEDTDQGRFEDRFHGAPLELSDSEDASSEAMEKVVLEPPEYTAEAVLAGEVLRAEAAEVAADDSKFHGLAGRCAFGRQCP